MQYFLSAIDSQPHPDTYGFDIALEWVPRFAAHCIAVVGPPAHSMIRAISKSIVQKLRCCVRCDGNNCRVVIDVRLSLRGDGELRSFRGNRSMKLLGPRRAQGVRPMNLQERHRYSGSSALNIELQEMLAGHDGESVDIVGMRRPVGVIVKR